MHIIVGEEDGDRFVCTLELFVDIREAHWYATKVCKDCAEHWILTFDGAEAGARPGDAANN